MSLVTQVAKELKVKEALDIGAGSGWLVNAFREQNIKSYGIDHSSLAIKKGLVMKARATQLPFPSNKFHLVTAISLIEHLNKPDTDKFLNEVRRVLRPNGFLFIVTPNFASPLRFIQRNNWHGFRDPTHIIFYTPLSLRNLLINRGFQNIRFTFPSPNIEDFDWTVPSLVNKSPKIIKIILNYLASSTLLSLLRNSFYALSQSTKDK